MVVMGQRGFAGQVDRAGRVRSCLWRAWTILLRLVSTLASWNARSGNSSWNSIFFDKPCGTSGKHAGRATGLV
jgi:hypothetical protein